MRVAILDRLTAARLRTLPATAALQEAAHAFGQPHIGLLVICHAGGEAAGVLSKSDLIRHLAAPPCDTPATVAGLMTRAVRSCRPDDDLHAVWQTMAAQRLQNVPVLDGTARPVGVLDIRDAMEALLDEEERQERMLADYIAGVGYQ